MSINRWADRDQSNKITEREKIPGQRHFEKQKEGKE
jgi:hypothetical protein